MPLFPWFWQRVKNAAGFKKPPVNVPQDSATELFKIHVEFTKLNRLLEAMHETLKQFNDKNTEVKITDHNL